MVETSLLELDLKRILRRVEELSGVRLPEVVLEATLEPELELLCVRFKRPRGGEFGEPVHPGIHPFRNRAGEITAVEVLEPNKLLRD